LLCTSSVTEPHLIKPDLMQHFNDTFPHRWIGRGSTNNWPRRYPDLTPLDFYLWGWLKSEVYRRKVDTQDELLDDIPDVITRITKRQMHSDEHAISPHDIT
jgi:hypothetical protein